MNMLVLLIRITLSLLIVYGVYTETGVWTTVFCLGILIRNEINDYITNIMLKAILIPLKKGSK